MPVTSDIDRLTDLTEELIARGQPADVRGARAGGADRRIGSGRALRKMRRRHEGLLCVTLGPRGSMLLVGDTLTRKQRP